LHVSMPSSRCVDPASPYASTTLGASFEHPATRRAIAAAATPASLHRLTSASPEFGQRPAVATPVVPLGFTTLKPVVHSRPRGPSGSGLHVALCLQVTGIGEWPAGLTDAGEPVATAGAREGGDQPTAARAPSAVQGIQVGLRRSLGLGPCEHDRLGRAGCIHGHAVVTLS
jgi:hypothetical protein